MLDDMPYLTSEDMSYILSLFTTLIPYEGLVYLSIDETNTFRLAVPRQMVTQTSIELSPLPPFYDLKTGEELYFSLVGSIHSHHLMPPDWSDTDNESDTRGGVHIVAGNYNSSKRSWELNCSVVTNQLRQTIPLSDIYSGESCQTNLTISPKILNLFINA
jgi:hypothetical protein